MFIFVFITKKNLMAKPCSTKLQRHILRINSTLYKVQCYQTFLYVLYFRSGTRVKGMPVKSLVLTPTYFQIFSTPNILSN